MDKQKETIVEMSKVIEEAMAKARRTLGGHNNIAMFYATMLTNAGYRKIPEGAVVLTREEYEKLKNGEVTYNQMVRIVAEKFAERVKMAFYYEFDELIPSIMADKIDEICKDISEGKV